VEVGVEADDVRVAEAAVDFNLALELAERAILKESRLLEALDCEEALRGRVARLDDAACKGWRRGEVGGRGTSVQ
jgi:hypothetical protein